jgi:hypothetical protein
MAVRPVTAASMPTTMAASHQTGGLPCGPPFWTMPYSAVPAGMPPRITVI